MKWNTEGKKVLDNIFLKLIVESPDTWIVVQSLRYISRCTIAFYGEYIAGG